MSIYSFCPLTGVAEKDAKAFVGSHWTMKIGYDDENMWVKVDSDEFPSMNLFMSSLEEEKEYSIPDKGFGKSSMVFSSIPDKPNMAHTITNTERFGSYEVMETYTEEGIKMVNYMKLVRTTTIPPLVFRIAKIDFFPSEYITILTYYIFLF